MENLTYNAEVTKRILSTKFLKNSKNISKLEILQNDWKYFEKFKMYGKCENKYLVKMLSVYCHIFLRYTKKIKLILSKNSHFLLQNFNLSKMILR